MTAPNIDTFEHDIANEIVHKEANIGDIASASGDIGNNPASKERSTLFIVGISILFLCGLLAVLLTGYLYYTKSTAPTPLPEGAITGLEPQRGSGLALINVSRALDEGIGRFVSYVEQSKYGYTLTISSYSPVFAYMNTQEALYAEQLAATVGSPRDKSTTTPEYVFTDATIDNQNMRVGTSGASQVVYAFVNTETLVIASTTEAIVSLRNAILR